MRPIRLGNDIKFLWSFFVGKGNHRKPYNLEGKNLVVTITDDFGGKFYPVFFIKENTLLFNFFGKDQRFACGYTLTLEENKGKLGMLTIDKIHPFRLVERQNTVIGGCDHNCDCCQERCDCPDLDMVVVELSSEFEKVYDYEQLVNKPKINHVVLVGDKSAKELGLIAGIRVEGEIIEPDEDGIVDLAGGGGGGIPEAPADGKLYGRQDKTWKEVPEGGGIPEAPEDGKTYGRNNGEWKEVKAEGSDLPFSVVDGKVCITFETE